MSESRRGDFYLIFLGVVLGFALTSIFGPRILSWYAKPPFQLGVDCTPAIDWGFSNIVKIQVAGMAIGALGLWTLSAVVRHRRGV